MSIFKPHRVRDIPQKKWAIPVPESLDEEKYDNGWMDSSSLNQVEDTLLQMGFEKATSQHNHSKRSLMDGIPKGDMREYALWIHGAGVIVEVSSKEDGQVASMGMQAEIDGGVYGRSLMSWAGNCGGSGSCEPQLSGTSHYCKSWNWHSSILHTLKNLVSDIQSSGKLAPFTRWSANELHVCGAFPLAALIRIDPEIAKGKTEQELHVALQPQIEAAIELKFSKWPGLKEMARGEMIDRHLEKRVGGIAFMDRDWWKAENALDYCRRAMKHAGIRWPNTKSQDLTEHWLLAIGSGPAQSLTAKDPLMVRPGPGGARFATCLAMEIGRDGGWDKINQFLDSMSDDQVKEWAGSLDAQGNTPFGELVISHATETSTFLPTANQIADLFSVVSQRIGVQSCPIIIGNKDPWLVLEDAFEEVRKASDQENRSAVRYIRALPVTVALFDLLEAQGCSDVVLDSRAMEMIDRLRQAKLKIDNDSKQGIEDVMPADIMAKISRMMMDKTVDAPKATANRQMGRI